METNRVKERDLNMSCFDRFTKLKCNDGIEVSAPLISFVIWQIFVWRSHAVRSNTQKNDKIRTRTQLISH